MKSKKALFKYVNEKYNVNLSLDTDGVSDETYGRDSRIYLWGVEEFFGMTRREFEADLKEAGFKVRDSYAPGEDVVEVSVSYFKGWHWDE